MSAESKALVRIADALERIADTLADQLEMAKIPLLDASAILKAGAREVQEEHEDLGR